MRYNLIHYIYTMFYESSKSGEPLLRAMWYEFRDDGWMLGLDDQFMFGSNILVCPKLGDSEDGLHFHISCNFPMYVGWYNWYTKYYNSKSCEGIVYNPGDD